jgi:hypothetical protein
MKRKKQVWATVAIITISVGGTVGRLHLIGPNPGTFFTLGVLATLAVVGIAYGLCDTQRVVRSGQPIGN